MSETTRINLNGKWSIQQIDGDIKLTGRVPGLVHHDLVEQGMVDDPYYGSNELDQQWVGESVWQYSRHFEVSEEQAHAETIVLNCDGLDTVTEIHINDKPVASTDNMFIRHRLDVIGHVKPGGNTIRIVFHPARAEMSKRFENNPYDIGPRNKAYHWFAENRHFLRKCQCHSGWDWGVCLLTQGIHRDIYLECRNGPRVLNATNRQKHDETGVTVTTRAIIDAPKPMSCECSFTLEGERKTQTASLVAGENEIHETFHISNPELWWPNGLGDQPLYNLNIVVSAAGETDELSQRIGLRTIKLIREKDGEGESFQFEVNGVPLFAKGANWIPSDCFDSRLTDGQIEWELKSAATAHHNMIRVWGGGIYERDFFYQTCDKLGVLVWQDFMFACALYPAHEQFLESVETEVRQQIRRLAHHPSIALWCGNNEIQEIIRKPLHFVFYDDLFIKTIQPIVSQEDPDRDYWPSSPCNGFRTYGQDERDESIGDVHYWQVWHGDQPFTNFLSSKPRFSSEFGFQSFPSPETMGKVTPPEDRNIASETFEFHQRCQGGNTKILSHIARHFKVPTSYEDMLYVSQALQALSIQTACEHWRRLKPHNMGTLIWQLNDIWPVASWSSLESDGRWKMLHYFERRFYSPLLISAVENDDLLDVWVTSDINKTLNVEIQGELKSFDGSTHFNDRQTVEIAPLASKRVARYAANRLGDANDRKNRYFKMIAASGDHQHQNIHFLTSCKAMALDAPRIKHELSTEADKTILNISSDTFAPFTWIRHGDILGFWSDNGLHLEAGEPRTLTFHPRVSCDMRDLSENLNIHTLYSSGKDQKSQIQCGLRPQPNID